MTVFGYVLYDYDNATYKPEGNSNGWSVTTAGTGHAKITIAPEFTQKPGVNVTSYNDRNNIVSIEGDSVSRDGFDVLIVNLGGALTNGGFSFIATI